MRLATTLLPMLTASALAAAQPLHDLVIYGGTSAGITAGIQARRDGRSVVVLEPTGHIGGLTTGGLSKAAHHPGIPPASRPPAVSAL